MDDSTAGSADGPLTLVFIGRTAEGDSDRASAYEDAVLPLLVEHGGEVVFRGRRSNDDADLPAEVHVLRVPSQAALDAYLTDERRQRLIEQHGEVFTDTVVVAVEEVRGQSSAAGDPDTAQLAAVVARLEHAQQTEDVDDFVGLFREDAVWTTGHGRRLVGRAEIESFTRQVLPGAMAESTATYRITHVVPVRPDVVAVQVRQQQVALDGEPLPVPEGRPTYVLAREADEWRIVAAQNTLVAEG